MNAQAKESEAVLLGKSADKLQCVATTEESISPNLYPSMDSIANLMVTSPLEGVEVTISVEIPGFTQKWEQTETLGQGVNYYRIKPEVLPEKSRKDLEKGKKSQIEIKIADGNGKQIFKKSYATEIRSIYAFDWANDEFGSTSAFNLLAWMRPDCDEVDTVNRRAGEYMKAWVNRSLAGYQFGDEQLAYTMLQAAAIQEAISDAGVVYQSDAYTLSNGQSILTPDAVVNKQHGLCVETALLMASCLQKAGMHPMLIITPGHAQCAVETDQGSGNYYLLETTILPYDVNAKAYYDESTFYNHLLVDGMAAGNAEAWKTYLESTLSEEEYSNGDQFGGNFVIDCDLLDVLNIKGLDV